MNIIFSIWICLWLQKFFSRGRITGSLKQGQNRMWTSCFRVGLLNWDWWNLNYIIIMIYSHRPEGILRRVRHVATGKWWITNINQFFLSFLIDMEWRMLKISSTVIVEKRVNEFGQVQQGLGLVIVDSYWHVAQNANLRGKQCCLWDVCSDLAREILHRNGCSHPIQPSYNIIYIPITNC